jgi:hypothetical protein
MPWVQLDDGFHSHRKVVTAGLEAVGLHCRALSWCGANLTDGHIPTAVIREFAGSRARRLAQSLVDAQLWEPDADGWRIHGWTERNPPSDLLRARRDAAADRQRRWRTRQNDLDVTQDVTRYVTHNKTHNVTARPSPSPSPTPMSESRPPLSLGDAYAGREDQESPGQDLFGAVRAARERAGRASTWWHDSALEVALEVARNSHPKLQPRELELALLTIASWPDTKAPSRLVHVMDKALREATQSNGQRQEPEPLPPLPPTVAELRARGELP